MKRITEGFSNENILDTDIIIKQLYVDDDNSAKLLDSYDACLVFLLLNLSSAYIELRHYSEALYCLNECELISSVKIPDVFFRRSQVRTYNKYSDFIELELALSDIQKAKELSQMDIYEEHYLVVKSLIDNKKTCELSRLEGTY